MDNLEVNTNTDATSEAITEVDSNNTYQEQLHSSSDNFLLILGISMVCFGLLFKRLFRKMYINVLGGRKGE